MLILGVDRDGDYRHGLIEQQGQQLRPRAYGVIRTAAGLPLAERLEENLSWPHPPGCRVPTGCDGGRELFFNKNTVRL